MKKGPFYIGIDPGLNTGFAVWNGKCFLELRTYTFWDAITRLNEWHNANGYDVEALVIFIEDPGGISPTFTRENVKGRAAQNKISQNVGGNKRDAQLIIEYCENTLRLKVTRIIPKSNKFKKGKITSEGFRQVTGHVGTTNQHQRDAGMLVFGR